LTINNKTSLFRIRKTAAEVTQRSDDLSCLEETAMKRVAYWSLLCLALAAVVTPTASAFADQHKDNMERRCKSTGGGC
jgi:hypothetical protein